MLLEKMHLQCGHKLRRSIFARANKDGLCPVYECRCPLTSDENHTLANQVVLWHTPMWELHMYGRPATEDERITRNSKVTISMGQCQGVTMLGKPCTCKAMRSNGNYCSRHVLQAA